MTEPSFPSAGTAPGRHRVVWRVLGFFAGAVLAVAAGALALGIGQDAPDSLRNRINAMLLPAELNGALFLYQKDGVNTLYTLGGTAFEVVSLGTTDSTVSATRRGNHLASVQRSTTGSFDVRLNTTLAHSSSEMKTSAAASPDGTRVAFAQSERGSAKAVAGNAAASLPSRILLVEGPGTEPRVLGDGFSPFFVSDTELAWFSAAGLMRHDLGTGSTTVLSSKVFAVPPPYPAPAVSRDGRLIAWPSLSDQAVHLAVIGDDGIVESAPYIGIRSPSIALGADALYALEHSETGTVVWRHAIAGERTPEQVLGVPLLGRIMQLIP